MALATKDLAGFSFHFPRGFVFVYLSPRLAYTQGVHSTSMLVAKADHRYWTIRLLRLAMHVQILTRKSMVGTLRFAGMLPSLQTSVSLCSPCSPQNAVLLPHSTTDVRSFQVHSRGRPKVPSQQQQGCCAHARLPTPTVPRSAAAQSLLSGGRKEHRKHQLVRASQRCSLAVQLQNHTTCSLCRSPRQIWHPVFHSR